MKCKYLDDQATIIEVDYKDSYEEVKNELDKVTNDEWQKVVVIKLEAMSFGAVKYSSIFDLIETRYTPDLKEISLSESSNVNIKRLKDFIKEKEVKELDLSNLKFNSQKITELTELFTTNSQLKGVDLHCCNLNDHTNQQKILLFDALIGCELEELCLSGNNLSDENIDFLIGLVRGGIVSLDIGYNDEITSEGLQEFLEEIVETDNIVNHIAFGAVIW